MRIRTRAFCAAAALLILIGLASMPARADDAADRKIVMDLFNKTITALKKKDVKGAMALITPDSVEKRSGMTLTRQQIETNLQQSLSMTKSFDSANLKLSKVTRKGNTIVAEGTAKLSMTLLDKMGVLGTKGATHKLVQEGASRHTIVLTKSGWQTKLTEEMGPPKILIDGKAPPAMSGGR